MAGRKKVKKKSDSQREFLLARRVFMPNSVPRGRLQLMYFLSCTFFYVFYVLYCIRVFLLKEKDVLTLFYDAFVYAILIPHVSEYTTIPMF